MESSTWASDARGGRLAPTVSGRLARPLRCETGATQGAADELVTSLFRAHSLTLMRAALLLVGDNPTAEDVVQEAFIGLFRAIRRGAAPEDPVPYLRASVVNGCRSVHRARQRALLRPVQHATSVWSAESAALSREESRETLQAVGRLPSRAREVLVFRYLLDLPDADIAGALGISKSTVSSTASRALAVLARELRGDQ